VKNAESGLVSLFALAMVLLTLMPSCKTRSQVLGRWQEVGKTSTIEFHDNGTFTAVDDMGMAVNGKYTLSGDGKVRFEIAHQGSATEIIEAKLSTHQNELTISFEKGGEIERYRRVNPSR
jgi:hypothetical protein